MGGIDRMQSIIKKWRSRRGASITFALLLFLVCAVVGSLVLAAGFAAAGRLAKLADSEQRFYAVNSAAELVLDQLCSSEVTVGMKQTGEGTYQAILPDKDTLAGAVAKYLVFGTTDVTTVSETQFNAAFPAKDSFVIETTVSGIPDVEIEGKYIGNNQLNLTVKAGESGDQYILPTIILEAEKLSGENIGEINNQIKEYTFNWKTTKGSQDE